MFEIAYLLVVAVAALPLARSLLLGGGGDHIAFVHRLYRDAAYIVIAILAVFCFEAALRISLENSWFAELGQNHRFWLSIEYRVGIFLVILFSVGLFVGVNLWLLCRPIPIVPRSAPWMVGLAIAGLVGFLATPLWVPLMRFLGAATADVADPVFGKDLSFYLLVLPLYDDVVEVIITIVFFTIVLWAVIGLAIRRATSVAVYRLQPGGALHLNRNIGFVSAQNWDRQPWLRQGLALTALLCLALGISRLLARYHLVVAGHSKVVAGASYADINFWVPGYDLVVICWWTVAAILTLAVVVPRFRAWLVMRRSRWLTPLAVLRCFTSAHLQSPPQSKPSMSARTRSLWSCRISSGASPAHARPITLPDRRSKSANSRSLTSRSLPPTWSRKVRHCRTRASGIGGRSSLNFNRSKACGLTTPFPALISIVIRLTAPNGRS